MGRTKMVTKFIEDRKSRNVTFNKRKEGLKKKAFEFSTLCDVDACLICFREDCNEPLTWPEERSELDLIVRRYLCISREEREKRQLDLSSFLDGKKKRKRLMEEEDASCKPILRFPWWHDRLSYWQEESLRNLGSHLDGKMEFVRNRIKLLEDGGNQCLLQQSNQQQQQHMQQVLKIDDELQPLPLSNLIKPLEEQKCHSGPESDLHTPAAAYFEFGGLIMPNPSNFGKFNHNPTNSLSSFMNPGAGMIPFMLSPPAEMMGTNISLSSSSSQPFFMNPGAGMVPFMLSPPAELMGRESNEIFAYNASFHQEQWFHGHQHFGPSADFLPSNSLHFQRMLLHPQLGTSFGSWVV